MRRNRKLTSRFVRAGFISRISTPEPAARPGKIRPVLVVQRDLLNETRHPSTWVLPCTTRLVGGNLLRVFLPKGIAGNAEDCEVMVDQSRAIDNLRFRRCLGKLPPLLMSEVKEKLRSLAEL